MDRIINRLRRLFHNSRTNHKIVTTKEAAEALKKVNRKPLNSFVPFKRPVKSDIILDVLEERWWNEAGDLLEDVWGLPDKLCKMYRQGYVLNARSFFTTQSDHAKVLDLGCGTGWFGRLIADESVVYQGLDFSETQILIARKKIKSSANNKYISFIHSSNFATLSDIESFNGVIINAFLHHLYQNELEFLFNKIQEVFKKGTHIFIMEPVYPTNKMPVTKNLADIAKSEMISSAVNSIKSEAIKKGKFDVAKFKNLEDLIIESDKNGFFFSPKETPFEFEEFESFISKYCDISKYYYVGVNDFTFLQTLSFVNDNNLVDVSLKEIYPIVKEMDDSLLESGYYFNGTKNYIFTCFECILK